MKYKYLTLKEYISTARKLLKRYGNKRLANNDDAIGYVIYYLAMADKNFKSGNRDGYRVYIGRFGVMNYKRQLSLDYSLSEKTKLADLVPKKEASVADIVEFNEMIHIIEDADFLTNRQKKCMLSHFKEKNRESDIASSMGISRQLVNYYLTTGISKLRQQLALGLNNEE